MEDREKELVEMFGKMSRETRNLYLSYGRVAVAAEIAAKQSIYSKLGIPEVPAKLELPALIEGVSA